MIAKSKLIEWLDKIRKVLIEFNKCPKCGCRKKEMIYEEISVDKYQCKSCREVLSYF